MRLDATASSATGKIEEWDRMIDVNIKGVLYGIADALWTVNEISYRPTTQEY